MYAHVIVSRKHDNGKFTFGCYLVDLLEDGLKDSLAEVNIEGETLDLVMGDPEMQFIEIDYDLAHNIIYQGLEYAEDMGAKADKSFLWTQYVLEEDTDDIPLIPVPFGDDGEEMGEEPSLLDASISVLMGMTDLIYMEVFGEAFMDAKFAEARLAADESVEYNELDLGPMTEEEFKIFKPLEEAFWTADLTHQPSLKKLIKEVEHQLEEHPDVPQIYDLLSNLTQELGETEKAYRILQDGIKRFPDNYSARFFYAIQLVRMGKIKEVEELIWNAYDINDLPVGNTGLGEFNIYLFYSLRCKIHMAKQEFDKAEPYYILVTDLFKDDAEAISELQKEILFEYSTYRKNRIETHYGKSMPEIITSENWFDKYGLDLF